MKHSHCITLFASFLLPLAGAYPVVHAQTAMPSTPQAKIEHSEPTSYRTIYMTRVTQQNEAAEVLTAMRNMLPQARLYYVPAQNALVVRANAEDMALAERMLVDLDRPRKLYRLTYTITEVEGNKPLGAQTYTLIIAPGTKTNLKQGSRVPIMTGVSDNAAPGHNNELQYLDIGWSIEASLDGSSEGLKLRSKVEQSSLAEDKPNSPMQDPVIRQTVLEGSATLTQGKPLMLGLLDVPGSTRQEDIQVVSEVVP